MMARAFSIRCPLGAVGFILSLGFAVAVVLL